MSALSLVLWEDTTLKQLPAMVATEYRGSKWIVFGNRRLKVLQELESRWPSLKARVIVQDMPNPGIEPQELARAFVSSNWCDTLI